MLGQPTDRGVHHRQAHGLRRNLQAVGGQGVDGAHVHQQATRCGVGEQAIGAQRDLLHFDRCWQHGDHHAASACNGRHVAAILGAQSHQLCHRSGVDVEHHQLEPLLQQIARHALAHAAQANETDLVHVSSSVVVCQRSKQVVRLAERARARWREPLLARSTQMQPHRRVALDASPMACRPCGMAARIMR
jgi:hypothetical protein